MRLLLVRHGATDWNLQGRCQGTTDVELSKTGVQQAKEVASAFSREPVTAVYSSDLKRARQTAHLISQPHGLEVAFEPGLRELDHGKLEGLTFEEIRATFPDFMRCWRSEPAHAPVPGGERLVDVEKRAWAALNRIVGRHRPEETLVVVSHNFPILAILCRVTATPLDRFRAFHLAPCEISDLSYHPTTGFAVLRVNGWNAAAAEES
jgi:broad specificity phosphatase PhoE